MPTYGTIKRSKPRVGVLRGFDPNEPRTRLAAYPVSIDSNTGATLVIRSGQTISLKCNASLSQDEWVLGVTALESGVLRTPYIALNDSYDEDVIEAGKLPGLSCSGQFEIRTGYFKTGDDANLKNGVPITFDGTSGDVKATTFGSGVPVIGIVTRGVEDLKGHDSSAIGEHKERFKAIF